MPTKPKLKVALVFDDTLDSSDGVAQYVKTVGAWLAGQGHEVCYLVGETKMTKWSGGRVYSLSRNVAVKFNGNKLSIPARANTQKIAEILAKEKFDVLHVQTPFSPFMAGQIIKRAGPAAVVSTFHILPSGALSSLGSRLLRLVTKQGLKRFDEASAVSPAAIEFARQAYGLNCQLIPNTIDVASFRSRFGPQNGRIVFLGRLVKRKGCGLLIKAFAQIHQQFPEARLFIGGRGSMLDEFKRLARRLGVDRKVEFVGYVSEERKPQFLAEASIACFPATGGESFGIVLLEAMAAGAGVVLGGDNPGYHSVLAEQPQLLFNPLNKHELAERLSFMLSHQAVADGLHVWQQDYVKAFDVEKVGPQVEAMYREAVAKRAGARA